MYVFFLQGCYIKLLNYIKSVQASKPMRRCDVNQGVPAFYKFFAVKAFRTLQYMNCLSGRWFPQEKLLLVKFFFCFVSSALSSVPCVLHRCSGILQPLFHLARIVKCGPYSSRIFYLLILYDVKSNWHSGICFVSFIVHVVHHHSTVMKFYRVQHQLCGIASLLQGLVS